MLSLIADNANPLSYAHHLYSDENTEIKNLVIPNSVTSIGQNAFSGCSGLTSVTIPNSVTSIGSNAFNGCSGLQKVIVNDIAAWCDNANPLSYAHHLYSDENTEIKNLVIPNSVTSIGSSAFSGCSGLTSVTIPNSVTSIGDRAFYGCSGLKKVFVNDIAAWCNISFGSNPLSYAHHLYSDENTEIKDLVIPNSVTSIGDRAFYGCSGLTSVTIPNSVTSIGSSAFSGCSGLTAVKVDKENPLSIDSYTFSNRANATLYVPKGSKAAYQSANYWKNFKAIVEFPNADVNQDGKVNVVDVVDIARFVVGTPSDKFMEFLADLNSDDNVNVADAVVLVNEIAGDQNFAKAYGAPRQDLGDDRLTLTENDDHSLSLAMESQRPYTAFQFDLYTNSEDDVMAMALNAARKNGHQLLYNKVDEGHYRVVALSVANNGFNGNGGELLNIQLDGVNTDDVTIGNIHFITGDGTDHRFEDLSLSSATGIESLTPNPSPKGEGNVYDLSGRKVSESSVLPKGVYVVNGKKVIVK